MRTTLDIEDDVFLHARQVAAAERLSIGKVVSRLLRQALQGGAHNADEFSDSGAPSSARRDAASPYVFKNGIPVIAAAAHGQADSRLDGRVSGRPSGRASGRIVTQELIDQIRDEEGI